MDSPHNKDTKALNINPTMIETYFFSSSGVEWHPMQESENTLNSDGC